MYVINEYDTNKKNEIFIRKLYNKSSFIIEWNEGAVLPTNHPNFYKNRTNVSIYHSNNELSGNINFEKKEYKINEIIFNEIYDYIEKNFLKLINISLNQNDDYMMGVSSTLSIKYKTIYLTISGLNINDEKEFDEFNNFKNDLKSILVKCEENNDKVIEINYNDLINSINEICVGEDQEQKNLIEKLVKKICSLHENQETTIANLMGLNYVTVEPLIQLKIYNNLIKVCKEIGISIIENKDEFGGLAYHYKFKVN